MLLNVGVGDVEAVQIALQAAQAAWGDVAGDDLSRVFLELGQQGGLAAGGRAGIQHALALLRGQQARGDGGAGVLHVNFSHTQIFTRQVVANDEVLRRLGHLRVEAVDAGADGGWDLIPLAERGGFGFAEEAEPVLDEPFRMRGARLQREGGDHG